MKITIEDNQPVAKESLPSEDFSKIINAKPGILAGFLGKHEALRRIRERNRKNGITLSAELLS